MNRITRRNFIFKHSLPFFVAMVLIFAIPNDAPSSAKLYVLIMVILTLPWYLYGVYLRFHDLGRPMFVHSSDKYKYPVSKGMGYDPWGQSLNLFFQDGQPFTNMFGPDPKGRNEAPE